MGTIARIFEHRTKCFLSHISNPCIIRNDHKNLKNSNVKCYF